MERLMTRLNRRMELKKMTKQTLYSSQLDSSHLTLDISIRHPFLQSSPLGLVLHSVVQKRLKSATHSPRQN